MMRESPLLLTLAAIQMAPEASLASETASWPPLEMTPPISSHCCIPKSKVQATSTFCALACPATHQVEAVMMDVRLSTGPALYPDPPALKRPDSYQAVESLYPVSPSAQAKP